MKNTLCFLVFTIIMHLNPSHADCQNGSAVIAGDNVAIVQTETGLVRGYASHKIYTFKGIPYGTADRFMPAHKPMAWKGTRSCLSYGPTCPSNSYPHLNDEFSFAFQNQKGDPDENCLNLNVWTTGFDKYSEKPVMVYLHGGGFSNGSSREFPFLDGARLSGTGNVVVVSFNHRLNVLGFLDLSSYGKKYQYSANAGAMDMVLALQWVKDNIANFGGDPQNVTIFGQSGGGTKVMCLMNAPSAKGLFRKAIIQSGSSLTHIIEADVAKRVSTEVLKELGLQANQVDSLQSLSYDRLAAAGTKALATIKELLKPDEMSVFGLEWEPVHDGQFLPYQPDETKAMELSKDIPLLVGSCKNEFMPFMDGSRGISMDNAIVKLKKVYGEKTTEYMSAVKSAYPETVKPSDFLDVDFLFRPLVIRQANQRVSAGDAPVFMYLFEWQSPVLNGYFKAVHNMDLPFVFNNIQRSEEMTGGGKEAHVLAEKVSKAWSNFARSGNPNHPGLPKWPAYTPENGSLMIFDNECSVKIHHDKKLLSIVSAK